MLLCCRGMAPQPNCSEHLWVSSGTPFTSAVMFGAGVLGNLVALVLLEVRRRRQSASLFQVLVTALVITDLLGTLSVSPLVLAAYNQNRSMRGLGGQGVCAYFGFSMTFLSLATLAMLLCMAVERWLAIGHPYLYERRVGPRGGLVLLPALYAACALFCLAPFAGLGRYVQYCPGTWCFIDMSSDLQAHSFYKNAYASCLLAMIACTVFCNASVSWHLLRMHRRGRSSSFRRVRGPGALSITKEVEHLVLLAFMTIAFLICSLPLVIRVFMSSQNQTGDLRALLMLSMNPIIDPWVFIILSPPVPRLIWEKLCKASRLSRCSKKTQPAQQADRSSSSPPIELEK